MMKTIIGFIVWLAGGLFRSMFSKHKPTAIAFGESYDAMCEPGVKEVEQKPKTFHRDLYYLSNRSYE